MSRPFIILLAFITIAIFTQRLKAQTTDVGVPKSTSIKTLELPSIERMPTFDLDAVLQADAINEQNKVGPWRFGYEHSVNLGLNNAGEWTTLANGDRIWRLYVGSEGALSINLILDEFYMPSGASVHLYAPDFREIIGAYTETNNNTDEMLGTSPLRGDRLVLEYYEPQAVQGQGKLNVGVVVHAYKDIFNISALKALNDSGDCNIDVNCPLGAGWENPINSVAMIMNGGGVCTGALVNNTSSDGTPYFLTANHCLGNPANWVYRFNWDSPTPSCATTANSVDPGGPYNDINGGVLRASNGGSDFALIELNSTPLSTWDVYYAGWDRTGTVPTQTTGIHHPRGDIKKICRDDDPSTAVVWGGADCWEIADWDQGVTEPGSSGSPLFDQNQRIVGQLYGGTAACDFSNTTTDNDELDAYGRFDVSWDGNSSSARLRDWLDPSGTNITILDGYNPNTPSIADDAGLTNVGGIASSSCNQATFTPELTLRNYGASPLTAVDIYYNLDGAPNSTYNWTGNLSSGTTTTITLPSFTTTTGTHTFSAYTDNPNGALDSNSVNDGASTTFDVILNAETLDVTIDADFYGSEITWDIVDSLGNVLVTGGPYSDGTPTTYIENECLAPGCYTFNIYDSYGDGLSWNNPGNYTLTDDQGTVLVQMTAVDGDFGSSATHTFCIGGAAIAPTADFSANNTTVCTGSSIDFTDISSGNPTTYAWTFSGGTPGTSSMANPTVTYNTAGTYDVELTVTGAGGTDVLTQTAYVTVVDNNISIAGNVSNASTGFNNGSISLTITGGAAPFTYAWDNGATGATASNLAAGTYNVTITDANGCTATQSFTVNATATDVIEIQTMFNEFLVYPNPTSDLINLEFSLNSIHAVQLELYSATGQLLQTQQLEGQYTYTTSLDMRDYSAGMYYVKVIAGSTIQGKAIIKK